MPATKILRLTRELEAVDAANTDAPTVQEVGARYLEWKQTTTDKASTIRNYTGEIKRFLATVAPDAAADEVNAVTFHQFVLSLNESSKSVCTVRRAIAVLKDFSRWAHNGGLFQKHWAAAIRSPRLPRTIPDVPSRQEITAMIEGAIPTPFPERDRAIVEVLYCNLRPCEVVNLDVADRLTADELLIKGKGNKERIQPIGEPAQDALKAYLPARKRLLDQKHKRADALFINRRGGRLTTRSLGRIVKELAAAKGLSSKIHPLVLRRAFATHSIDGDAPIAAVSQMMGHAHVDTTMGYIGRTNFKRTREAYDRAFNR